MVKIWWRAHILYSSCSFAAHLPNPRLIPSSKLLESTFNNSDSPISTRQSPTFAGRNARIEDVESVTRQRWKTFCNRLTDPQSGDQDSKLCRSPITSPKATHLKLLVLYFRLNWGRWRMPPEMENHDHLHSFHYRMRVEPHLHRTLHGLISIRWAKKKQTSKQTNKQTPNGTWPSKLSSMYKYTTLTSALYTRSRRTTSGVATEHGTIGGFIVWC